MPGDSLTGNYRVRAISPALSEVYRLCNRMSENIAIRRHALKLRYWPQRNPELPDGMLLDLNWSWVKSLPGLNVGELRIDDVIAGKDNLRAIFFVGDPKVCKPLPVIWILRVMQKSRQDFTKNDLRVFRARRTLVLERFYNS
jgi:hypothetical protein